MCFKNPQKSAYESNKDETQCPANYVYLTRERRNELHVQ